MTGLRVVTWNVDVENSADNAQRGLEEIAQSRPHVIVLQECYHYRPHLEGYTSYQLANKPDTDVISEDASVAALIRDDVHVRSHRIVRMHHRWRGPKAGREHAPRVFHSFVLEVDGTVWKVAGGHWAFPTPENGPAVAEHRRWVRRFLRGIRPAVFIGDLNQHASPVRGRRSTGFHVDRAILARCTAGRPRQGLSMYGGDHYPVTIDLERS